MIGTLLKRPLAEAARELGLRALRHTTMVVVFAWAMAGTVQAFIVHPDTSASGSDPALTPTYSTFPYWNYIGLLNAGTGVYLDNGWVLTANHVGAGNITLNGQLYTYNSSVPTVRLYDPLQPSVYTDLLLFKLTTQPRLAPMQIGQDEPTISQNVLMAGAGYARAASSTTWDVNTSTNPWTWTTPATKPNLPDFTGYLTQSPRAVRWGTNRVSDATDRVMLGATPVYLFGTQFNTTGTAYEAQAVDGDSGGGVWVLNGSQWELAGTIVSVSLLSGQPSGIGSGILDYSKTYAADLSVYRSQIMSVIFEPAIRGDLNDDKVINSLDIAPFVLVLTDEAAYRQQYPQVDFLGTADINGDGVVNSLDVGPFVNLLIGGSGQMEGFAVPEPTSGVAGVCVAALIAGGRRRR